MRIWSKVEVLFALFGLYFMSGSLTTPMTRAGTESSLAVQAIGALLGVAAFIALALKRGATNRAIMLYWPVLVPPLLAVVSIAWSVNPELSFRRAGSLILTTLFALWLVERFSPRVLMQLFFWMSLLVIATSTAAIYGLPKLGIHQLSDLDGANHAGSWRGLFNHKNDFGRVIALTASILLIAVFFNARWRWIALPLFAFCTLLILRSNSSQALMLYITVGVTLLVIVLLMKLPPTGRGMLLIFTVPLLLTFQMSSGLIFDYILQFLGRDATLSGRTDIWSGVLLAMKEHLPLGGGYGAGWEIVGVRLFALTGIEVGHAHNGYLDLVTDLGVVGLLVTMGFMIWLAYLCFAALMQQRLKGIALLGLMLFIFTVAGNWVGSFLLKHNSLFWLIPVVTFCLMRQVFNPYSRPSHPERAGHAPSWQTEAVLFQTQRVRALGGDGESGGAF